MLAWSGRKKCVSYNWLRVADSNTSSDIAGVHPEQSGCTPAFFCLNVIMVSMFPRSAVLANEFSNMYSEISGVVCLLLFTGRYHLRSRK